MAKPRLLEQDTASNNSHTNDMQTADEVVPRAQKEIKLSPSQATRFWAKVDKSSGPDACWLWTASKRGNYGSFGDYALDESK